MKIAESSGAQSLQSSYPWGLMNINEPRRGRALWLSCAGIFHSLENLHADNLIGSRGAVESQISKRRCSPICKWRAQRVLILVLVNCMLSRGRRDGKKKMSQHLELLEGCATARERERWNQIFTRIFVDWWIHKERVQSADRRMTSAVTRLSAWIARPALIIWLATLKCQHGAGPDDRITCDSHLHFSSVWYYTKLLDVYYTYISRAIRLLDVF